jgi:hypothetical protein
MCFLRQVIGAASPALKKRSDLAKMKNPTIISAVICEDIRQEASGKFSLAGVLGASIDIAALPATAVIGLYAEVRFHELGPVESQFRIVDSGDNELLKGTLKLNVPSLDSAPMVLGPFQLKIVRDGEVRVQWKTEGADWMNVKSVTIRHNPRRPPAQANPA